ncbi:hypothetical protein JCM18899A_39610 [Nocardioides sp. AN3]
MEPHERVGVVPVPTRLVPTIDHDHIGIRVLDEGVDEGHAGGSGSYDEVVSLKLHVVSVPKALVPQVR